MRTHLEKLTVLIAALLLSGCGNNHCKKGTLLLHVDLLGSSAAATRLEFDLTLEGTTKQSALPHASGDPAGTIEIQFPAGYKPGAVLTVGLRAIVGDNTVIGVVSMDIPLAEGCTNAELGLGGDADLAGLDLAGADFSTKPAAPGQACDPSTTCLNGSTCVDGICCTSACTGQCEACNVPGKEGTCSPILGAPVLPRAACTGAGDATCGGSCDGTNGAACTYPTVACRSASCTGGVETAAASCATGSCPAATTNTCATTGKVCGLSTCTNVLQLVAGYDYSCARLEDTSVRCWGGNDYGQLGLGAGNTTSKNVPTAVPGLKDVAKLAASNPSAAHTCALLTDKTVKCWGGNLFGSLGRGTQDLNDHGDPQLVLASAGVNLTNIVDLALGNFTSCFVDVAGAVKCLGSTFYGVSGQSVGTNTQVLYPTQVTNLTTGYSQVSVGGFHACAVSGNNNTSSVNCSGTNGAGQLGTGATSAATSTPQSVTAMVNITNATLPRAIAATTGDIGCAIDNTSVLKCWGSNTHGRLGRAQTATALPNSPTPAKVCVNATCTAAGEYLAQVKSVCGGDYHMCALRDPGGNAGQISCWGESSRGQLGDGLAENGNDITTATLVALPAAAVEVTCGTYHTCARLVNGRVYCWGWDGNGQLGINGNGTDISTPTLVNFP